MTMFGSYFTEVPLVTLTLAGLNLRHTDTDQQAVPQHLYAEFL